MNRPFAIAIATLFFIPRANANGQMPIANLQRVLDHPVTSEGQVFDGDVYLYIGETAYYFFPHKVSDAEFYDTDIVAMPGRNSDSLNLGNYKTGTRLHLRAKIHADPFCFKPDSVCTFGHFITLDDPTIIQSGR